MTVDQNKIKRWHPKFKLDNVPDIDVSAVPEPPVTKSFTSAQDCLDTARELMIPRVGFYLLSTVRQYSLY